MAASSTRSFIVLLPSAAASVTVVVTGTATDSIDEADIVAGGKTIIITLTGTTWIEA